MNTRPVALTGVDRTFTATTDYIYTGSGDDWAHGGGTISGSLGLSTTLARNGSTNGTYTLALEDGSFAIDIIPYANSGSGLWNGSPTTGGNYFDQRGVETKSSDPISIGAYSGTPQTVYYMAKSDGNWSTTGGENIWWTSTTGECRDLYDTCYRYHTYIRQFKRDNH